MSEKRKLRIYCPVHEASFEVEENSRILCEITAHALSSGFPDSEFWEFCCNCGTFSPSKLGRGEKARTVCFSCENEISKRCLCASCKVVSFECATQAKGRNYFVTPAGIEPECPGCRSVTVSADGIVRHECADINAVIYLADGLCPFCLEKTSAANSAAQAHDALDGKCPRCGITVTPGSAFCGQCKYQLRGNISAEKLGTAVIRPQLLGSFCPNCSTPITPGSMYCVECGQAIRSEMLPPPPPPPPKSTTPPPVSSLSTSTTRILAGLIGGGLFFLVLIAIGINSSISRNPSSPSGGARTPLSGYTPSPANHSPASNTDSFVLSENIEYKFSGTVGTKSLKFSISITRKGTQLTGTAQTPRSWDKLVGTLDSDGYFNLDGYEKGDIDKKTGQYTGQISANGTMTGRWSDGISGSDFTVYK